MRCGSLRRKTRAKCQRADAEARRLKRANGAEGVGLKLRQLTRRGRYEGREERTSGELGDWGTA